MKNINTIVFNSDLTVKSQTESPIQAFSSYQNIIRAIIPYDTSYLPFGIFHATNDAGDVANPTQLILFIPNGTATVDGETYFVYEQKVPEAVVGSLRASKVEFVLSLWAVKNNFIGVQRYDETEQGYNDTTYIAAELLTDFPNAENGEYVRVFNTETDWVFNGTTWSDTDDVFETILEDSRSEIVEFPLYRGKSTGKPTHKPSNTEAIIESLNLKVSKTGDVMTGTLEFANAGLTRLILGNNNVTTDGQINATTFDNGDEVSDAIKFSDLATLFTVTATTPAGGDNWLDTYATAIEAKFDEYTKQADLNTIYFRRDGTDPMTGDINVGSNDITNVGTVDGVDVSQFKNDYDTHTHTESEITDLDKYTQQEVDNLLNDKVDKTTTIAGLDLQNNITVNELKTQIGNATESLDGLLSSTDKATINTLTQLLTDDDENNVVDTLQEILNIFEDYPEGADLVTALAGKVDNADVGNRTYTEENYVSNDESVTASIDALDQQLKNVADDLTPNAEQNVQSDWDETDTNDDAFILNKPDIYTQEETNGLLDDKAEAVHTHNIADVTGLQDELDDKEDTFNKNTAFNKDFGTTSDTVAEGSHISDESNPHSVTASQVGAYTTQEVDDNFAPISHTHVIGDVTGLQDELDDKIDDSEKGQANGVATLDSSGKIPINQIPLQFDDVLQFADLSSFPATGEEGKLYIDISTNSLYRWDGTDYVAVIEVADIVNLGDIPDVNITGLADNYILKYDNATSKWVVVDHNLEEINNVNITTPTNGEFLKFDGTNWVNDSIPTINELNDIGDVNAPTPTDQQVLYWNNSAEEWQSKTITKTDVGLNNVQNYGVASQAEAEAGTVDNKYMTPLKTKQAILELAPAPDLIPYALDQDLQNHVGATNNPHSVTKTQVGLSNVDNTSDLNKPISTATQSALDGKEPANANIQTHISSTTNPHNVTKTQVGLGNVDNVQQIPLTQKGAANGVASLDANSKVPLNQLPDTAKQQTYVVATFANLPTTNVLSGDKGYVTGTGDSYIWNGSSWLTLAEADWENVNLDYGNITNPPTIGNGSLSLGTSGIASGSQTFSANQTGNATFTVNVPGTNIAQGTRTTTTVPVTSSTGSNATLQAATTSLAGVMTSADKTKLDGIQAGAQVNVGTNLGSSGTGGTRTITSSTGNNTSITYTASDVGAATTQTFTTTLDTSWSGTTAPYTKTQTVNGILSTDNPIVDVVMSGTFSTDETIATAWSEIYRITTNTNSITLTAFEKPTVNLPIQLKVVR